MERHIKNNRGVSLTEMVVAMGIGGLVTMAASTVFIFAIDQFTVLVERHHAEEAVSLVALELKNLLSQAIDIDAQVAAGRLTAAPTTGVIVSNYNSGTAAHVGVASDVLTNNGNVDLLAAFYREWGDGIPKGGVTNSASNILPTAIYFQRPRSGGLTSAPQGFYGRVIIDLGLGTSPWTLQPTTSDSFYDRFTNINIQTDTAAAGLQTARTAQITLTGRYFRTSKKNDWRWCSVLEANDTNGCGPLAAAIPVVRTITVNFRNNELRASNVIGGSGQDRMFGRLYFYKLFLPALRM